MGRGGGLAGGGRHRDRDGLQTRQRPRPLHHHAAGISVVGWVSIPVGVHAGIHVPDEGPLLAQPVRRGGSVEGGEFTEGDGPVLMVHHRRRERGRQFQSNRHAEGFRAVSTAQRSVRVVNHQQQLLALEARRNLPRQRLRGVHRLKGPTVDELHTDTAREVAVVHRPGLQVHVADKGQIPC